MIKAKGGNRAQDKKQKVKDVFNYYLKLRGLTITELARRCGYAPQSVFNMLTSGEFSDEAANKFSEVLLCTPEELMNGEISQETKGLIQMEHDRLDYTIVSDEELWMRTLLLSQQRTIENLSFLVKDRLK